MRAPATNPAPSAEPAPRVIVERPPPGLQRGRAAAPRWLLALVGALALLLVGGFYLRQLRRKRPR